MTWHLGPFSVITAWAGSPATCFCYSPFHPHFDHWCELLGSKWSKIERMWTKNIPPTRSQPIYKLTVSAEPITEFPESRGSALASAHNLSLRPDWIRVTFSLGCCAAALHAPDWLYWEKFASFIDFLQERALYSLTISFMKAKKGNDSSHVTIADSFIFGLKINPLP